MNNSSNAEMLHIYEYFINGINHLTSGDSLF